MPTAAPPEASCACGHSKVFHQQGLGCCRPPCECRRFTRPPSRCHQVTNWNRPDHVIAAEIGIPAMHVTNYRQYYLVPGFLKQRWKTVDWRETDQQIARRLDVTTSAVYYQRKKMLDKIRNNK